MDALLERFCRYVRIESTAVESAGRYPSSDGQLEMGRVLSDELRELGLNDVHMSEQGIVTATIPPTVSGAPTIAWFAHVDTSPEFTGKNVNPIVHKNYDGNDIKLPAHPDRVIRVDDHPDLAALTGKTIITTDGTTLLGADDKSGVAIIMETAARMVADSTAKRGPIRVCFTCDEEIGHGVDHIDLKRIDAVCGYTLDGEGQGVIEGETFSADLAVVTVEGVNTHPGYAKDRMTSAIRVAAKFIDRLPFESMSPETTSNREGFMHPYVLEGGVPATTIRIILRDFDTAKLTDQHRILRGIADQLMSEHPAAKINVDITPQYRNMAEGLAKEPRAVELAVSAVKASGVEPRFSIIRGGTDGSRLTEMGLPTPNLSAGMHNFHSPLEWSCLEEMEHAVNVLIQLAEQWSRQS